MNQSPPGNYISKIDVEDLFGEFTYQLQLPETNADPRVFILYGDNGSGKTTILKLLRSLLSPDNDSGHRGVIAGIPFKRFSVTFRSGQEISATREAADNGSYVFAIVTGGKRSVVHVHADPDLKVRSSKWNSKHRAQFEETIALLKDVSSEVRFLDDKRTFSEAPHAANRMIHDERGRLIFHEKGISDPVVDSVGQVSNSIRREALVRQKRGSGDSQSIYKNLIRRIAHGTATQDATLESLIRRLGETETMSLQLAEIGLTSPLNNDELVDQISSSSASRNVALVNLVEAYVESTEAWFSALTELKALVDKFVEHLNYFIKPKTASFTVADGLSLLSKSKAPLSVSNLSSGERHLVMMLSQSLLMRNSDELLVIDEPELSLNVKWQRELVNAILDCIGGSPSQIILATHSIEIASKYRNNIVQLLSKDKNEKAD